LDLAPFASQDTGAVQQERAALDPEVVPAVQALFLNDIEQSAERLLLVGEQREWQLLLLREAIVRADTVTRDAHHHDARLAEGRVPIAEVLTFPGATGSHVLRIEIQHQLFARRILQSPRAPAARGEGELPDAR